MTNCMTSTPANTWTRAPGTPSLLLLTRIIYVLCTTLGSTEAIYFIEYIMEHISQQLATDSINIKQLNYYKNGDTTITNQTLTYCNIADLTKQLLASATYADRVKDIVTFNQSNRWRKRGISVVPVKYGSIWNGNQYGILISIFHGDGSVAVAHAGSEMGQGINTKVAQVVARELGIPLEMVHNRPLNTMINPNATSTGGSVTSELVCLVSAEDGFNWLASFVMISTQI